MSALLLAVALSTVACGWDAKESVFLAVWSDDDTEHAYLVYHWEERKNYQILDTVIERRNYQYQLWVQRADGSERRSLTDLLAGELGPDLYYMKGQGYVLFSEIRTEPGPELVVHRISLSGDDTIVARGDTFFKPCGALTAVPSPDGTELAVFERVATSGEYPTGGVPGEPMAECAEITITVRFLDAEHLAQLGTWSWEAYGFTEFGWRPDGEFYVQAQDGSWRVDRTSGPHSVVTPSCLLPKTTSSSTSAAGVHVEPTEDPSNPVTTWNVGGQYTFEGCGGS